MGMGDGRRSCGGLREYARAHVDSNYCDIYTKVAIRGAIFILLHYEDPLASLLSETNLERKCSQVSKHVYIRVYIHLFCFI